VVLLLSTTKKNGFRVVRGNSRSWQAHDFALDTDANLQYPEKILLHHQHLRETCGTQSSTEVEAARSANSERGLDTA
jgi:hypothetical protein